MTNSEEALSYLAIGWSVIPCKKDKKPYFSWAKYQKQKPTEDEIKKWWTDHPDANLAVITGKISGIVAIDIDSPKGALAYSSLFNEIHKTIKQQTGKEGGCHLLFKYPNLNRIIGNTAKQLEDVDTRADGGYILIDPSIHPSGRKYQWVIDPRESPDDLMDLPRDVLDYFWPEENGTKKTQLPSQEIGDEEFQRLLMGVKEGERDDACARLAGKMLRMNGNNLELTYEVLENWDRTRNDPPMGYKQVRKVVESILKTQGRREAEGVIGSFIEKIERLIYPSGEIYYRVYLEGYPGYMKIDTEQLLSVNKFGSEYLKKTKKTFRPPKKRDDWLTTIDKLMAESIDVEMSEDETILSMIRGCIKDGLAGHSTVKEDILHDRFVVENGVVKFRLQALLTQVKFKGEKNMTHLKLAEHLRNMGLESKPLSIGHYKRIKHWSISRDLLEES